jgi:hypothetical protein
MPAQGAVKAGANCSRAGKVVIKAGDQFKCIKKGKKLVWVKSVKVPAPVLTPTPTPSPTPTPTASQSPTPTVSETPSPTPTPLPSPTSIPLTFAETLWAKETNGTFPIEKRTFEIPSVLPTSWDDVYEKRLGIPYKAWLSVSQNIAANKSKLGKVEMLVGPNTVPNFANLEQIMDLVSRAVPSGKNPVSVRVFAFNFTDAEWANQEFQRLYANETARFKRMHPDPIWEICPKEREVCYQQAFVDTNLNGIIIMGMVDKGSRAQLNLTYAEYARAFRGQVIAHEYLHTIEAIHQGDRRYIAMERTPTWFSQGTAVFMEGAAPNHNSFVDFMRFRMVDSAILYNDCPYVFCIKLDAAVIQDYLSLSHQEKNWDNFPYSMKYMMSARVVEILVALKGPDSMINMFDEIGQGRRFDQAFEKVYGISYESAKPIIARIVAEQFANGR